MQETADFSAPKLARSLLRRSRQGALATLMPDSGDPYCSLVNVASNCDGSPILLISRLALHTRNILGDPRVSLMLDERAEGDPLEGARIMLAGRAEQAGDADEAVLRRRYLNAHPSAEVFVNFKDFSFFRIRPAGAHLVAGFGRIVDLNARAVSDRHFRCRCAAGGRAGRHRAHECRSSRRDKSLRHKTARRGASGLALHRLRPRWNGHAGR